MSRKPVLALILILVVMGMLSAIIKIQRADASGTIYIRADGSVWGTDRIQRDGDIYSFTANIYDTIVVEKDDIIIDGNGYTLQGSGVLPVDLNHFGFGLFGINNVTIKKTNIKGFTFGVLFNSTSYSVLYGNNITNNYEGVILDQSFNTSLSGNNIAANNEYGLYLGASSNTSLSENVINSNEFNFYVWGSKVSHFMHSIDVSNLINGKPIHYLVNQKDLVINPATYPQVRHLALINCINVTVESLTITNNTQGLLLAYTNASKISDNNITNNYYGIQLFSSFNTSLSRNSITNNTEGIQPYESSYNTISGNSITNNHRGVVLKSSSSNSISGNNVSENGYSGIHLIGSSNNIITENNITNNGSTGVVLAYSSNNNTISKNNIMAATDGINLSYSSNNTISENNITNNDYPGQLHGSSNNKFYHNNFINTHRIILDTSSANSWDDGYPSGGNYWSDNTDVDEYSGVNQDKPNPDGISDTPYIINEKNRDNYPFMSPWPQPPWFPESSFICLPLAPALNETVTFNASSSHDLDGHIVSYAWDFGDGTTSTEADPIVTHVYTTMDSYTVILTVTDNDGLTDTTTKSTTVGKISTFVSISTNSSSTFVGFKVDIAGRLRDMYGNGLRNETVVLYYTFHGTSTWIPITSDATDNLGNYHAVWIPPATGYFTIKAEWLGNTIHFSSNNSITLSTLPYEDTYVFSVESNSTVSAVVFNTSSHEISFTASGPSGTRGYVKSTIAKSLVPSIANVRVYLDDNQTEYSTTSIDDSYILTFEYTHSVRQIVIKLNPNRIPGTTFLGFDWWLWAIIIVVVVALAGTVYFLKKRKPSTPQPSLFQFVS